MSNATPRPYFIPEFSPCEIGSPEHGPVAWFGEETPEHKANAALFLEAVNAHDRLQAEHEKAQVLYRQVEAWNQDGQPKGVACPDGYLLINKDRAADILVASHRYAKAVKEVRGE